VAASRSRAASLTSSDHLALGQALRQVAQLDADDLPDLGGRQRVEHHHLVDPVDELGPEVVRALEDGGLHGA
jgi:hypothetical protein